MMMIRVKMFRRSVRAFMMKMSVIFKKPKKGLNFDTIIEPRNNPPIRGNMTSSCQIMKKMLRMKGTTARGPKVSNELSG